MKELEGKLHLCPYFTMEESETQREEVTCPRLCTVVD